MNTTRWIGLALATTLAATALAFELPTPKGAARVVKVLSEGKVIAELRVLEAEGLTLDPKAITVIPGRHGGNHTYLATGGVTLKVLAHGKPALTLSADHLQLEGLKGETLNSSPGN